MSATPTPRPIAPDGPVFSPIVAGAWRMADWGFTVAARQRWIEHCLELGISTFDHADIYGNYQVESLFGEVLAAAPTLRQRMQIVTKCGIKLTSAHRPAHRGKSYDTSREHVRASVEASLRALRTERVDLLLIHRPDPLMDPAELAETFRELRDAGKVSHFGVSNHTPSRLALLHRFYPLVTNQVELSPLHLDPLHDGTLDQSIALGMRPMIWSPLGGGRLMTGDDETALRVRPVLDDIAQAHGVTAVAIVYAWILRHPSRPLPITGSRRLEALQDATAALSVSLSSDEWYRIWEAGAGHEVA